MNLPALENLAFSQEPAVWIALGNALLLLGVTFGLPLTPEQKGAIDAVLAVLAGILIRSQVTPTTPPPVHVSIPVPPTP